MRMNSMLVCRPWKATVMGGWSLIMIAAAALPDAGTEEVAGCDALGAAEIAPSGLVSICSFDSSWPLSIFSTSLSLVPSALLAAALPAISTSWAVAEGPALTLGLALTERAGLELLSSPPCGLVALVGGGGGGNRPKLKGGVVTVFCSDGGAGRDRLERGVGFMGMKGMAIALDGPPGGGADWDGGGGGGIDSVVCTGEWGSSGADRRGTR
mmetsp:Transcript_39294/g.78514  ORF Transcript_39294/g.78514 Transcript_39294/m.78514 type:complete len:211 (+) Transcript_39294:6425-7057(+)